MMKTIARLAFALLYFLAVTLGVLLALKPGAAIFYYQMTIKVETCMPEEGFAFRCPVNVSQRIFPPDRLLLFEEGQQLYADSRQQVGSVGDGRFIAKASKAGGYNLFLAPYGNSHLLTNAKNYRVYFAFRFFSRTTGILCLSLLLPGLLGFARFAFSHREALKNLQRSPYVLLEMVSRYLARERAVIAGIQTSLNSSKRSFFLMWGRLCRDIVFAAYGLVFIEWIFQVTGTSFLAVLNLSQKTGGLLLTALFLVGLALILIVILFILSLAMRLVCLSWAPFLLAEWIPAVLWVAMIVLLVDNFTYVVFSFGILTSAGLPRVAYGIVIGVVFVSLYWHILKAYKESKDIQFASQFRRSSGVAISLICISLAAALLNFVPGFSTMVSIGKFDSAHLNHPNIILIGSDALNAEHLSIYGYERDTTPSLRALGSVSLVAENAFTNANSTLGSIASMFTSKLPTQTRVIFPPDILKGVDAFEHLPGILSAAGYTTVEIGVPYYVDAYAMNVQNGFDEVNQRSTHNNPLIKAWRDAGYQTSAHFVYTLGEKLTDRFLHAFHLASVDNPIKLVTQLVGWAEDRQRMEQLLALLSQNNKPLFVHVHLLGTHGDKFVIEEPQYSLGQEQSRTWMVDFYDDAILAFDRYMGELIAQLKSNGQYENTILIIYSDHPMRGEIQERIPLILHFPGDQYAGRVSYNVQNLDIAPTLLDYLGQDIPDWMTGRSLLSASASTADLVFSASRIFEEWDKKGQEKAEFTRGEAPFYQFEAIQVVACDHWYTLNLWTREWESGLVDGHTAPCAESDLPSKSEIKQSIIELMVNQGYDVSSLR